MSAIRNLSFGQLGYAVWCGNSLCFPSFLAPSFERIPAHAGMKVFADESFTHLSQELPSDVPSVHVLSVRFDISDQYGSYLKSV